MEERKLFKFYKSYFDIACKLSDKDRLKFYDAIMQKQFYGIEPKLTDMAEFAYVSQKHSIDAQVKGWEDYFKTQLTVNDPMIPPMIPPMIQLQEKEEEKEESRKKTCFSFDDFWKLYPNKASKEVARKSYEKISEDDRTTIKETLKSFIDNIPFKGYNYPMASTYLNQKRFNDEIEIQQTMFPKKQTNNIDEYEHA